jgi:hypothetical protein
MVRQFFGAPAGRQITGARLRVRRTQDTSAPLELRIEQKDAGTVASATVSAGDVRREQAGWVRVRFAKPVSLPAGTPLALTAASRGGEAYEAFPIRQGTEYGFDPRTVFNDGYAQFFDGEAWQGWDQWGEHDRRDGDLQFAIDTAAG